LAAQGRDVKLSEERIEGYRHFVNKIWNAARFSLAHFEEGRDLEQTLPFSVGERLNRWMISRTGRLIEAVEKGIEGYRFNEAAHELYHFIWHEFCDWYLEFIKPVLYQSEDSPEKRETRATLYQLLKVLLKLVHPFMPFVSERIYRSLPTSGLSLLKENFPRSGDFPRDDQAEREMEFIQGLISEIRNLRGEMNIPPSKEAPIFVRSARTSLEELIEAHRQQLLILAKGSGLDFLRDEKNPPYSVSGVVEGQEVFISLKGLIQFEEEISRLEKELEKLRKEAARTEKKLANEDFLSKAPQEVVEKEKEKIATLGRKIEKLSSHAQKIRDMMA
jgi:valyl-tRNA synthetase